MPVQIIKRSKAKSAVGAAAYRSGTKMTNEWDGLTHDYTRKRGVVHSEIILPPHAPPEFQDRSTLWNSVEMVEKTRDAQLAREIEISLPVELNREEQLRLARSFISDTFVAAGMCADFSIHDKKDGNPHFHVMLTIRPLKEDGQWGAKCRKVYELDESGQRIPNGKGGWKNHREDTTDWNDKGNVEKWRAAWAAYANRALEAAERPERIDHRSYERQGIDKIPSIHLGVAASQMERKGIATEKGNINRQIAADNKLLKEIKARITRLYKWTKEQAEKPEGKDSIMAQLYEAQLSTGKPGFRYGKIKNLKESAALFNFLNGNNITSMEQLYEKVAAMNKEYYALRGKIVTAERRIKVLDEHLSMWEKYERNKGTRRQFDKMKPGKKKEQFEQKHSAELALYEAAVRYLEKLKATGEEVTPKKWQAEADRLKAEKSVQYQKMKAMREDIKAVENLKKTAEQLARTENEPARKKEEQEL
ncbi:MAG: MobA/MobL family protein [Lachnospiraceae bacterium]